MKHVLLSYNFKVPLSREEKMMKKVVKIVKSLKKKDIYINIDQARDETYSSCKVEAYKNVT